MRLEAIVIAAVAVVAVCIFGLLLIATDHELRLREAQQRDVVIIELLLQSATTQRSAAEWIAHHDTTGCTIDF